MINITSANGKTQYNIYEFVCDTPDDLISLPKDCGVGSTAFIISTGDLYMINSNKEWVKL